MNTDTDLEGSCQHFGYHPSVVRYTISGEVPGPLGSAHPSIVPFQSFPTKDDSHMIIALGNDNLWKSFCKLIGREDLSEHPKFATNPLRTKHRKDLEQILIPEFKKKTRKEWLDLLGKAGLPHSPANNIKEICEDPHIAYRKMLVEVDQPRVGKMRLWAVPSGFRKPQAKSMPPPLFWVSIPNRSCKIFSAIRKRKLNC